MALLVASAVAYAVAINLTAFAIFGIDKRRAIAGAWRIRESTLIGVALAGGWLGAKAAQRRFRHKSRKQPFARRLNAAGVMTLGLLLVLGCLALSPRAGLEAGASRLAEAIGGNLRLLATAASPRAEATRPPSLPHRFGPGSGDGL